MRRRQIAMRFTLFGAAVVCVLALVWIALFLKDSYAVASSSTNSGSDLKVTSEISSGTEISVTPTLEPEETLTPAEPDDTTPEPTEEPEPTPDPTEEPEPTPEATEEPEPTPEPSEEPEPDTSSSIDELYRELNIDQQFLTPNEYSRPQIALDVIEGIVVHYVGNPGSTAKDNRDYFEDLKTGVEGRQASSHFVIGLEGEIIQCIPLNEIAYASNSANYNTVSIECCHPDEDGQFTTATYQSLVKLCTWLCKAYDIPVSQIIRHYDVTGKICPRYYVLNPDAWDEFKETVAYTLTLY